MAFNIVQFKSGGSVNANSASLTPNSGSTLGSFLFVGCNSSTNSQPISSITDNGTSGGNTWTFGKIASGTGVFIEGWYVENAKAMTTLTVNFTGTSGSRESTVIFLEITGVKTSSSFDAFATATGNNTSIAVGPTGTTAQNDEIAIMVSGAANGVQNDWGTFTLQKQDAWNVINCAVSTKVLTSTGTVSNTATNSSSQQWAGIILTFKSADKPTQTKTHTTDALIRKAATLTHTTDAMRHTTQTKTHTTDALKRKGTVFTHTTDSNKRKAVTVTHTTDANKRKATTVTHTTDAMRHTTPVITHTTDALIRKATTLTHTTDALKRKAFTVTHTTDSYLSTKPVLRTISVTNITKTTATGNGEVVADGGETITERGFIISTHNNPTIGNGTKFPTGGTTGTFSVSLTGLTAGTTYYAVAYATNIDGTGYGTVVTFKTTLTLDKDYIYHVFNGTVELGILHNVESEFGYSQNIDSAGASMTIIVGQSPDTPGLVSPMGSDNDTVLIRNGNRIVAYEISDTYPTGKVMFRGEINRWEADYENDKISILVWSDGSDLNNYILQGDDEALDNNQNQQNANESVFSTASEYKAVGQTWKTGSGITVLSAMTLKLNSQNISMPVTLSIYSAVGGTLLGSSTVTVSNNAATDVKFSFSPTIATSGVTTYFSEITVPMSAGTLLVYYKDSNVYANGVMYIKDYLTATTSTNYGGQPTDSSAVGTFAWTNPNLGNSQSISNYAQAISTTSSTTTSHYLKAQGFGFSVPSTATVTGIKVEISKHMTTFNVATQYAVDNAVKIVKSDGSIGTTNKGDTSTHWSFNWNYVTYGGTGDLWGESWTPSDINNANFGAVIAATVTSDGATVDADINDFRITVYWTISTSWNATPTGDVAAASDIYFKTYSSGNATNVTYTTTDPSAMLLDFMGRYNTAGGLITASGASVDNTGITATYTFKLSTAWEAIKKVLELAPTGWYFYVDVATNVLYFKATPTTATWTVTKGKNLNVINLVASIENIVNSVFLSGGPTAGVNLFKQYNNAASVDRYGTRIKRMSDNRIVLTATADLIGNSEVNNNKDEQYQTQISILDGTSDITLYKVGDTVGFNGFQTFVDKLILQIVRVDYSPDEVKLTLGVLPPRVNLTIDQLKRDLADQQTLDNPGSPS